MMCPNHNLNEVLLVVDLSLRLLCPDLPELSSLITPFDPTQLNSTGIGRCGACGHQTGQLSQVKSGRTMLSLD